MRTPLFLSSSTPAWVPTNYRGQIRTNRGRECQVTAKSEFRRSCIVKKKFSAANGAIITGFYGAQVSATRGCLSYLCSIKCEAYMWWAVSVNGIRLYSTWCGYRVAADVVRIFPHQGTRLLSWSTIRDDQCLLPYAHAIDQALDERRRSNHKSFVYSL